MYISRKRAAGRKRVMAETEVAPEATELLFETEEVADLVAEATGETVAVETTEDAVEFTVGEGEEAETFVVEPEGDEEILEASTRVMRGKKAVKASTRSARPARRTVRRSVR